MQGKQQDKQSKYSSINLFVYFHIFLVSIHQLVLFHSFNVVTIKIWQIVIKIECVFTNVRLVVYGFLCY